MAEKERNKRNLVFVSHATPEDNHFTLWLSTRLKLIGYEVWSDVTKLFGGEKWWEDIGDAIQDSTFKFVIVITKTSLSKPGVQREVELALAAELQNKLPNFIIPIIIDDSEFGGQPYGLSDRNIIPFSRGWGFGIERLVERLERDQTPKFNKKINLGSVLADIREPSTTVELEEDVATSNSLEISDIPEELNFFRIPGDVNLWKKQLSTCPYAWFEWSGMLGTFANRDDLMSFLPSHVIPSASPKLNLPSVLNNEVRNHKDFLRGEIIKKVNNLVVETWNNSLFEKGLHKYELSNGRISWFFPKNDKFEGLLQFPDQDGQIRRKKVLGFSPKNNVYWHFAIEAKIKFGFSPRISLIPHVVFTEDGRNPLKDSNKMHGLRRGFCKNWWNPRWRDLLLLYVHLLSEGSTEILLDAGKDKMITVASRPTAIKMNYRLTSSTQPSAEIDEIADVEVELMDEKEVEDDD
ncbi:toll/interleukin-1 receptor domain-containing protein [Aliiglaciecola sp. M165]|uniref:toll/interleukin-1 receptor domain-containing protein n=1 Tax=Aliiglaciecola sp. M165 TaxID=2593649 RepID=UPI001181164F|nr:toll/interleukin-1 receptor domain-containing protein [Aliiglaciecola sp. M165]TRY33968.1 toll/interleukin-1 receptor domain-containing protein [Aliiglaciecola sp. M165]